MASCVQHIDARGDAARHGWWLGQRTAQGSRGQPGRGRALTAGDDHAQRVISA